MQEDLYFDFVKNSREALFWPGVAEKACFSPKINENQAVASIRRRLLTAHQREPIRRIGVDAFAEVDMFSPVGSPAG